MKKFFSIILTILLTIMLFATLFLGIVRKYVSFQTIVDLSKELTKTAVTEIQPIGLYHPGQDTRVLAQYSVDPSAFDLSQLDLSTMSLDQLDISSLVSQYAGGADIDPDFLGQVLEDESTIEFEDYFVTTVVDYLAGVTTELNFDSDKIETFVNKTIDKYEDYSGEKVDRSGLSETISATVEMAAPQITAAVDDVKKENEADLAKLQPLLKLLKPETLYCAIGICAVLCLLILLINRNIATWLKYIGVSGIVSGLLLFIGVLVAFAIIPDSNALADLTGIPTGLVSPVMKLITMILMTFRSTGIITGISGILLLTAGCILGKKKKTSAA